MMIVRKYESVAEKILEVLVTQEEVLALDGIIDVVRLTVYFLIYIFVIAIVARLIRRLIPVVIAFFRKLF